MEAPGAPAVYGFPGAGWSTGAWATVSVGGAPELDTASDDFRMFCFKITPCAVKSTHPWDACPYAHPHENARRRDPRARRHVPDPCPDYRHGLCLLGDGCPFAHGVYERHLHPARYRTRPCAEGAACARRVCFFAHSPSELRAPTHEWSVAEAEAVRADRLAALAADPEGGDLAAAAAALLAGRAPPLRPLRTTGGGSGGSTARGTPRSAADTPRSPGADGSGSSHGRGGGGHPSSPFGRAPAGSSAPGSPHAGGGGGGGGGSGAGTPLAAAASRFGPHAGGRADGGGDAPRMSMAVRRQLGFAAPPPRGGGDGSARGSARGSAAGSGAGTPRGAAAPGRPPHHPSSVAIAAALASLPSTGRFTPSAGGGASPAAGATPRDGGRAPPPLPPTAPGPASGGGGGCAPGGGSGDLGEAVSRLGVRFSFMGDERMEGGTGAGSASSSGDGGLL